MNYKALLSNLSLAICFLFPHDAKGQNEIKSLTKVGGYLNFNHPSGFGGFIFSLENERVFKKSNFFSHGPRLDYDKDKRDIPANFPGIENLFVGYEVKYYPFHFIKQKPYQGFFLGLYPCYLLPINKRYKNGPGLASLAGYQYMLKNKLSFGLEMSVIYMQNVNKDSPYRTNTEDRYFYFTGAIKIGYIFSTKK